MDYLNHRSASGYNAADLQEAICRHVMSHGHEGAWHRLNDVKISLNGIYTVFGRELVEHVVNGMCETVNGVLTNPGRWVTYEGYRMVFKRDGNNVSFHFGR